MNEQQPPHPERPDYKVKRLPKCEISRMQRINDVRRMNGIRPQTLTVKTCLACGSFFETVANRTCGCLKYTTALDIR